MRKIRPFLWGLLLPLALLAWGGDASGGGRLFRLTADTGGEGQGYVHLIVREVRVTPIVAHVGDPVRVDMVIENRGEGYETTQARILANGKEVAGRLFTYGTRGSLNTIYRETFTWDTASAAPGEYRIRGEVDLFYNFSPSDTYLDVDRRLVLLPRGAPLPAGATAGETAFARDPRYKPPSGPIETGEMPPRGGY